MLEHKKIWYNQKSNTPRPVPAKWFPTFWPHPSFILCVESSISLEGLVLGCIMMLHFTYTLWASLETLAFLILNFFLYSSLLLCWHFDQSVIMCSHLTAWSLSDYAWAVYGFILGFYIHCFVYLAQIGTFVLGSLSDAGMMFDVKKKFGVSGLWFGSSSQNI